ncbi:MAG: DUF2505 domain-containing protein [Leptospiraceae bacterium]|nr:DUF2505 domain-containing protein [Leptospiraceae bacterium]
MKISQTFQIPFPINKVYELFTNQEHLLQRYEHAKCSNVEFLYYGNKEQVFRIQSKRLIPSTPPALLKNFVKSTTSLIQIDDWILEEKDEKRGNYEVEMEGLPVHIKGELFLLNNMEGKETEYKINAEINISIPLIGNTIASQVASDTKKTWQHDVDFLIEVLTNTLLS